MQSYIYLDADHLHRFMNEIEAFGSSSGSTFNIRISHHFDIPLPSVGVAAASD